MASHLDITLHRLEDEPNPANDNGCGMVIRASDGVETRFASTY